jgi:hypothetical protein
MKCERCVRAEEARYRAYSDIIDMKVCGACAVEGQQLGLGIEVLNSLHSSLPRLEWPERRLAPLVG